MFHKLSAGQYVQIRWFLVWQWGAFPTGWYQSGGLIRNNWDFCYFWKTRSIVYYFLTLAFMLSWIKVWEININQHPKQSSWGCSAGLTPNFGAVGQVVCCLLLNWNWTRIKCQLAVFVFYILTCTHAHNICKCFIICIMSYFIFAYIMSVKNSIGC